MHGHDANGIIRIFDDHRAEAAALGDHFRHAADGLAFFLAESRV
jgi:hypothetical protein